MNKKTFIELLLSLDICCNECYTPDKYKNTYPRIDFWDYIWEYQEASGSSYSDVQTYQVSFYSKTPRHEKLIELRKKMSDMGLYPTIYHEYVDKDKVHHSYFSIELYVYE